MQEVFYREILNLVRGKNALSRAKLEKYHENDIAKAMEYMTPAERKLLYRALGERISEVFAYLEHPETYLSELPPEKAAAVIAKMDADDAIDVLEQLDDARRTLLINLMDRETREDISLIDSYEEDQIGSRMTTNFVVIAKSMDVRTAMRSLIEQAAENDNISTIYVEDESGCFYGAVSLNDLIVARADTSLERLIITSYPFVYASEMTDQCVEQLKEYSEDSIPVLDENRHILGVITAQDIVEITDDVLEEDYAKLAGLTAGEHPEETVFKSITKRLPWLLVLLILGLLVSTAVGAFENVVKSLTLIVCFQSLILDMAGNTGTQSLAVTIRRLSEENMSGMEKLQFVWKEIRIAFCNGFVLASASFLVIGMYIHFFKAQTVAAAFSISGCIGLALLLAMIISGLTGTAIPLFFHKIKVDPAVASGPLITTVNDLVAVVTYYGLAWLLLIHTLS